MMLLSSASNIFVVAAFQIEKRLAVVSGAIPILAKSLVAGLRQALLTRPDSYLPGQRTCLNALFLSRVP